MGCGGCAPMVRRRAPGVKAHRARSGESPQNCLTLIFGLPL
jgi:hypothetical protein